MNSGTANAESRYTGICVVFASLLFLISAVVHGVIHPEVGASAVDSMPRIAQRATVWQVAHLFFALSAALFSAAALIVLCTRSRLTNSLLGVTGWSLLVILGGPVIVLTTMEATALADAAVANNLSIFATWFSLSRGLEIVSILLPLAFLAISWNEYCAAAPLTPKWACVLSMLGTVLVIVAIVGASGSSGLAWAWPEKASPSVADIRRTAVIIRQSREPMQKHSNGSW